MSVTNEHKDNCERTQDDVSDGREIIFRVFSILSYFIVLVIVGLPVWWFTTRVYRANLPLSKIYELEVKNETNREFGIPLSLEYDILISIVHPDPAGLNIELNGEDLEANIQPFLKTISPIAEFVVKSQWIFLTELGAIPSKVQDHYALEEKQLPHLITPLESKLWSHLSTRPTINLVIYFPHCKAPLYIYNDKNEKLETNAFLSPRWGGITIVNADRPSCEKKMFIPDLRFIIPTFITQLQHLFKMNGGSKNDIHKLKTRKAEEMIDSTKRTLKSLAQLLSEINSIVISDEVGQKINVALENTDLADSYLKKGDVDTSLKYSKIAFSKSEAAFSDPSLLALLYFPDDQKYAVYIPLFLPVMIPVFMSLTVVRKWYVSRKLEKIKSD